MESNNKRLIGYIRVSSEQQEANSSMQEQRTRIQAYCTAFNYELVGCYEEVGSGTKMATRPQFNAALDALRNGEADGIIALKLDRIARNTRDVLSLVDDVLRPLDKMLVLLDLNVDTSTPTGRMILTVMAAVATLEADTIKERCTRGQQAKKAAGGHYAGQSDYGTQVVDDEVVVDEQEQEVIETIRRHHKSGKSYYAIAKLLNSRGILSPRGKTWRGSTVQLILERYYAQKKDVRNTQNNTKVTPETCIKTLK